jgi:hypothetical protein
MSTLHKNSDVRMLAIGLRVRRAAAQLPQHAVGNLFTVTGGRIRLIQLIGEYTVAANGAQPSTLIAQYLGSLAGASAVALSVVSAALAGAVKTSHLWLPAAPGSALSSDLLGQGGQIPFLSNVLPPGTVQIDPTATNQVDARVQWDLYYVPVDLNATVAAA